MRRIVGVHERARAVVDRLAGDRHVVGVHHAVDEADQHPLRDQRRLPRATASQQREVAVGRAGQLRVVAARSRSPRARERCRASPRAAKYWNVPTRMWLAATRVSTAPGSSVLAQHRLAGRTTASARVVGMPSACIASPMRYSRSIGPTAALPSPPRENGVRPEPFSCDVAPPAVPVDHLAEQERAPVAELRHEAAELVAGVGLRDRRRSRGHDVAGEHRCGKRRSSAATSRPSSAASAWLSRRSSGVGTVAGVTCA